jgi:hypothetical protein
MICEHCGWLIPADCTCRGGTDWFAAAMLVQVVEGRHRQAVARAYASGWALEHRPAEAGTSRNRGWARLRRRSA